MRATIRVVMHRLSKNDCLLDTSRPEIRLRNHNKVKFKTYSRIHEMYLTWYYHVGPDSRISPEVDH